MPIVSAAFLIFVILFFIQLELNILYPVLISHLSYSQDGIQIQKFQTFPSYNETGYDQDLRSQFHFSSKRGWNNDPNGMVYYNGEYHLYFQHNPKSVNWGNMTWGHAVSKNMVNWKQLNHAILPYRDGTIFSGTAVVDHNNTLGKNTNDNKVIALDAKVNIDDNALFRNSDLKKLLDESEVDPKELEAEKYDLSYVKLDGKLGCMVNGAGLAMATMDIIKLKGSSPANFLDVGGGASKEKVSGALKIIISDKDVKAILINIFGGIMRCDIIAEGIVEAVNEMKVDKPLIVRLEGTNVERGKEILSNSGLEIVTAKDLEDAAEKAVSIVEK